MSTAPHTPGPWRIEQPNDYTPHIWITAEGNPSIAKIETCDYDDGLGERLTDQDQTNARLISAAPEMLEALETIADFAPGNGDVCEIIAKRARAAIAKATGES